MPEIISINSEEITRVTKEVLEKTINNESYKHSDAGEWNNSIVEQVIQQLINHDQSYKYIVTCAIIQKNGAGLNTATSCYWNNSQDKYYIVRWENKHLHCIVHIFTIPV